MRIRRRLVALAACLVVGAGMLGAALSSAETGGPAGRDQFQGELASSSWW
jgi:hypothetical protein